MGSGEIVQVDPTSASASEQQGLQGSATSFGSLFLWKILIPFSLGLVK